MGCMYGGITAAGSDRLIFATHAGDVLFFDLAARRIHKRFGHFPYEPELAHFCDVIVEPEGTLLLADTRNYRVRRFSMDGVQLQRFGRPATREDQDEAGVLAGPRALLLAGDVLWVCCGDAELFNGVQRLGRTGDPLGAVPHGGESERRWSYPQGIAEVEGRVWIAETGAACIHVHELGGSFVSSHPLEADLQFPIRLAADGFGGALLLAENEMQEPTGVVRLDGNAEAVERVVTVGPEPGKVQRAFDIAALPDGRFLVADLLEIDPADVRLQLFRSDGTLEQVIFENSEELGLMVTEYEHELLARTDSAPAELYSQARVLHRHAQGDKGRPEHVRTIYEAVLESEPEHLRARTALASLLLRDLRKPREAEREYLRALEAGGEESDMLARVAQCRREAGNLNEAIRTLEAALEKPEPPESYHTLVEELGTYYLERSAEAPEGP